MKKLIALVFALVATAGFAAEFPDISIADLKQAIADKKVTVIDVNGAASYQAGHVPTAIDFATQGANLASVLPADKGALLSLIHI